MKRAAKAIQGYLKEAEDRGISLEDFRDAADYTHDVTRMEGMAHQAMMSLSCQEERMYIPSIRTVDSEASTMTLS